MGDIQFYGGYVNAQQAAASRLGAPAAGLASADTPSETPAGEGADSEFSFGDFLDIINPLQHIPIVSTLYREITGDEISATARVFGGTLFGGPGGFVAAVANTLFDEVAGQDLGATAVALFDGEEAPAEPQVATPPAAPEDAASGAMTAEPLITAAGTTSSAPARGNTAPAGLFTGQDALNALFNDLQGGGRGPATPSLPAAAVEAPSGAEPIPPIAPPKQSATAVPAKPAAAPPQAQPTAHPQMTAAGVPEAAFARQMMQALEKYQAMAGQRPGAVPGNAPDERRFHLPKL